MCFTFPIQIKEVAEGIAKDEKGVEFKASLIPDLEVGDWVLAHANLALKKISAKEAEEINILYEK